jgi:hypothetical protein
MHECATELLTAEERHLNTLGNASSLIGANNNESKQAVSV